MASVVLFTCPKTNIDDVISVLKSECDFKSDGTTTINAAGWQAKLERKKLEEALRVQYALLPNSSKL